MERKIDVEEKNNKKKTNLKNVEKEYQFLLNEIIKKGKNRKMATTGQF